MRAQVVAPLAAPLPLDRPDGLGPGVLRVLHSRRVDWGRGGDRRGLHRGHRGRILHHHLLRRLHKRLGRLLLLLHDHDGLLLGHHLRRARHVGHRGRALHVGRGRLVGHCQRGVAVHWRGDLRQDRSRRLHERRAQCPHRWPRRHSGHAHHRRAHCGGPSVHGADSSDDSGSAHWAQVAVAAQSIDSSGQAAHSGHLASQCAGSAQDCSAGDCGRANPWEGFHVVARRNHVLGPDTAGSSADVLSVQVFDL